MAAQEPGGCGGLRCHHQHVQATYFLRITVLNYLVTSCLTTWVCRHERICIKNPICTPLRFALPQNDEAPSRGFDSPTRSALYPMWQQIPYNTPVLGAVG